MTGGPHIFVPVYFDAESFLILREKVSVLLPEAVFHVIDDSAGHDPAIKEFKGVIVHTMPGNLGHQRALVEGLREFLRAKKEECLIVTMDADGEDRPEDLPALIEAHKTSGDRPFVLALRTSREETALFKFCYFFYKILFRSLTGTLIRTGNFALFSASRAREILGHPYFDHAYASTLFALGKPLTYVPCPRGRRYRGKSKMSFGRLALHGLRMLIPFRRRIAWRVGALLLLAAFAGLWAYSRQPVRLLAIGESTTFLGGELSWPRLLEGKLRKACGGRISVAAFAIPGSDTYDMAARIPAGLSIFRPRAVISMLGINDYENTTRKIDAATRAVFARGFSSEAELNEAVFQHVLENDPWRDRRYAFLFSRYYRDRLLFDEGVRRNQEVLKRYPRHPWALSELGAYMRYSNNSVRSVDLHRQAIAAEPANLAFRLELLGDLLARPDDFETAYKEARAALSDDRPLDFFAAGRLQGKGDWAGHLALMHRIVNEGCRSRKCMLMLKVSLEKNGRLTEASQVKVPAQEPPLPVTDHNYRSVIDDVKRAGAAIFLMQYPLRRSEDLKRFQGADGLIGNEDGFQGAYEQLFTDRFAGDFGHFTPAASELVAESAARSLLPWLKSHFLCGILP